MKAECPLNGCVICLLRIQGDAVLLVVSTYIYLLKLMIFTLEVVSLQRHAINALNKYTQLKSETGFFDA